MRKAAVWESCGVSDSKEAKDLVGEMDKTIGANLRAQRERSGLSQAEVAALASAAGLSSFHQTTIARIERGERPLRATEALMLARILETSLEYLAETGATVSARAELRRMGELSAELSRALGAVVRGRLQLALYLDRLVPVEPDEDTPLMVVLGEQLKTNIDPGLLEALEEELWSSDPEMRLAWVYAGEKRQHEEFLALENRREVGTREAGIHAAIREYFEDDGER